MIRRATARTAAATKSPGQKGTGAQVSVCVIRIQAECSAGVNGRARCPPRNVNPWSIWKCPAASASLVGVVRLCCVPGRRTLWAPGADRCTLRLGFFFAATHHQMKNPGRTGNDRGEVSQWFAKYRCPPIRPDSLRRSQQKGRPTGALVCSSTGHCGASTAAPTMWHHRPATARTAVLPCNAAGSPHLTCSQRSRQSMISEPPKTRRLFSRSLQKLL
jgi:hypothetical protein